MTRRKRLRMLQVFFMETTFSLMVNFGPGGPSSGFRFAMM